MGGLVGEDDLPAEVAEHAVRVGVDDDPVRRGLRRTARLPGGDRRDPRYPDAGAPSSPAIPSSDFGTSTTTRPAQSAPHAWEAAGTARSARFA
ncbi:hypothetical protein SAVCW2_17820 [Streptomyces avermitilis]|nr:hypothetical protein SAVCW2_17820 [Streptomyces avermitilis]